MAIFDQAVPLGVPVVAQAAIAPRLSERPNIFMLQPEAPDTDIVIASTALNQWPMPPRFVRW